MKKIRFLEEEEEEKDKYEEEEEEEEEEEKQRRNTENTTLAPLHTICDFKHTKNTVTSGKVRKPQILDQLLTLQQRNRFCGQTISNFQSRLFLELDITETDRGSLDSNLSLQIQTLF